MALQSDTIIHVLGKEISVFKSIKLKQELASHHTLEIICRMDVLEDLTGELAASSKNFLGEVITLQTSASLNVDSYQNSLEFKGIVTHVKTIKGHELSEGDSIVIIAKSPSYIADDGPHYASYNDVSLSEIIETTFQDYDTSMLGVTVQPQNNATIHYSVQQNESSFEYVKRLAAQHGEWFYYNGDRLVFGAPETDELLLRYGLDLKKYELGLEPKSHNYLYYTDDYLLDEVHEKDAKAVNANAGGYHDFVSGKASAIFNKETKIWHQSYSDDSAKQRLDTSIEVQKKAIEIQQVQLSGVSDNPGVRIGGIVIVEGARYRVIEIEHVNNTTGDYLNNFKALSADFDAYPFTNIHAFPKSEAQSAVVMENNDPLSLGRIRVQFPWQVALGEITPWLRIITPHAGGNKGFHFIPEIQEEILVGFEGGNAERPYVIGSLYNGNQTVGAFNTPNNDIKAIRTRSGHTIELNDAEGGEMITITDKNSNVIRIDTVNNNIEISALENMTFNAKNIQINAQEEININAGTNMAVRVTDDLSINAKNSSEMLEENKTLSAKEILESAEKIRIESSKDNMELVSSKMVDIQANDKIKLF